MNLDNYPRVWVTSDTHFGHANIIKYCDRPFASTEEMNQELVNDWNSKVKKEDLVLHLGDVAFLNQEKIDYILSRLNGKKLLILGNHDRKDKLEKHFSEGIFHYLTISRGKQKYVLMHYPIESWDGKFHGVPHLHGHCHGTIDNKGLLRFDMGWDVWKEMVDLDWLVGYINKNRQKIKAESTNVKFRDVFFEKLYSRATKDQEKELEEISNFLDGDWGG